MKHCPRCKEDKPFESFAKDARRKDGFQGYCRLCLKDIYDSNKEHRLAQKKEYYERNVESMRKRNRDKYANDPQKFMDQQRSYYSTVEGRKKRIITKARERAKQVGLEFDICVDDIVIPTHCPYLGVELTHDLGKGQLPTNSSIDRIDSSRGYVKGNVQIISRKANTMKNNATKEELLKFAVNIQKEFM